MGLDWKLLENLSFKTELALLKWGPWAKAAYVDYSSSTSVGNVVNGANVQINPDRDISPLVGIRCGIEITF